MLIHIAVLALQKNGPLMFEGFIVMSERNNRR